VYLNKSLIGVEIYIQRTNIILETYLYVKYVVFGSADRKEQKIVPEIEMQTSRHICHKNAAAIKKQKTFSTVKIKLNIKH
jgi:hypothetical protein